MKATGLNSFMARIDAAEYGLCCRLNRGAHRRLPRRVFQVASRLGDGWVCVTCATIWLNVMCSLSMPQPVSVWLNSLTFCESS